MYVLRQPAVSEATWIITSEEYIIEITEIKKKTSCHKLNYTELCIIHYKMGFIFIIFPFLLDDLVILVEQFLFKGL